MEFYIKITVVVVIASLGWVVSHYFTSRRDLKSALRQRRIDALTNAYDVLIRVGLDKGIPARRDHAGNIQEYVRDFERSIVMIHLYGNRRQVELVNALSVKLADDRFYDGTDLINELRNGIRDELNIERISVLPHYSKVVVKDIWLEDSK